MTDIGEWMKSVKNTLIEHDRRIRNVGQGGSRQSLTVAGAGAWTSASIAYKSGNIVSVYVDLTTPAGGSANVPCSAALPAGWNPNSGGVNYYVWGMDANSGAAVPFYMVPTGVIQHVFNRTAGQRTLGLITYVAGG
jgi:hypothetical protein